MKVGVVRFLDGAPGPVPPPAPTPAQLRRLQLGGPWELLATPEDGGSQAQVTPEWGLDWEWGIDRSREPPAPQVDTSATLVILAVGTGSSVGTCLGVPLLDGGELLAGVHGSSPSAGAWLVVAEGAGAEGTELPGVVDVLKSSQVQAWRLQPSMDEHECSLIMHAAREKRLTPRVQSVLPLPGEALLLAVPRLTDPAPDWRAASGASPVHTCCGDRVALQRPKIRCYVLLAGVTVLVIVLIVATSTRKWAGSLRPWIQKVLDLPKDVRRVTQVLRGSYVALTNPQDPRMSQPVLTRPCKEPKTSHCGSNSDHGNGNDHCTGLICVPPDEPPGPQNGCEGSGARPQVSWVTCTLVQLASSRIAQVSAVAPTGKELVETCGRRLSPDPGHTLSPDPGHTLSPDEEVTGVEVPGRGVGTEKGALGGESLARAALRISLSRGTPVFCGGASEAFRIQAALSQRLCFSFDGSVKL
ncbi:PREDICTED: uncharacterized protein LOC103081886 [Lipotes vexillifer]|uniref:Uncharacterized protein LOC103081886 n=1 Tax=Lipotes vexillifer TaxID=118797 RepID=A0A340XTU1_LIPVE|nr:PREDICTED: uncharacterized protein LOC103081886 [Lipotes vexillifer]